MDMPHVPLGKVGANSSNLRGADREAWIKRRVEEKRREKELTRDGFHPSLRIKKMVGLDVGDSEVEVDEENDGYFDGVVDGNADADGDADATPMAVARRNIAEQRHI